MTDNDQEHGAPPVPPPPRRRKATATKRVPPPPRRRAAPTANGDDQAPPWAARLVADIADIKLEVDRLKGGSAQFIDQVLESKVIAREADLEELTPFQASLRAQTKPVPENFVRHERPYNYPMKLYAKPDGMIVELQGDPGNRSYYRDKGYVELDQEQARLWYSGERQKLVAVQREKANLINTLREQVARDPSLKASISSETEQAWDHMSVAELEAFLDDVMGIPDPSGKPRRKLRPPQRLVDAENRKAEAEKDRLMAGVDTAPPASIVAQFEAEQEQATQARRRGRDIEITPSTARSFA
jgi:hypothetical protein